MNIHSIFKKSCTENNKDGTVWPLQLEHAKKTITIQIKEANTTACNKQQKAANNN